MSKLRQNQRNNSVPQGKYPAGLAAGTCVMTMDGALPVEYLIPGDKILTRAGVRKLINVSVRVDQDVAMVSIGAGSLGHDRPGSQTLIPLHQMILIRDWRAQALYGAPQALVAAGRLADGNLIQIRSEREARLFTLEFASDVVIYADGLELACLRETVSA